MQVFSVYTCNTYIFALFILNGKVTVIDTHPVRRQFGGNGNGIIKIYPDATNASALALGNWLQLRMKHLFKGSSKAYQSLLVLSYGCCSYF